MKIIAYLRVSTQQQDINNQKLAILEYADKNNIKIDEYLTVHISSRKSIKERKVEQLIEKLNPGDMLLVSELSRLGRSLGQIISIVNILIRNEIKFNAIKENIFINGKQDIQSKVTVTLFGLFAEIERDLISQRTIEGLKAIQSKGKKLGRPKGIPGKSRLNGKEQEIKKYLDCNVSKAAIARLMNISRTALYSFINSRKLNN